MSDGETDVLIVGGGVAGLALAGFLDDTNYRPTVVERTPDGECSGWAIGLRRNAVAVLDKLGVFDEAVERGSTPAEFEIRTPDRTLVIAPVEETFLALHRNDLVGVLRDASEAELRTGTSPTDIEPKNGSVEVEFEDSTEEYDIVVGADGVGSWVGAELFHRRVDAARTATWSFRVPGDADAEPPDSLVSILASGTGVIADEVNGEILVNMSTRMDGDPPEPPAFGQLTEAAEEVGWHLPAYVDTLDRSSVYFRRDYEVTVPSWHTERVALIGDAAHAVHPIVAMGATLALEDAYILADELLSHDDVFDAFASYEERRRQRVTQVGKVATVAERVVFAETSLVTAPRNLLTRAVPSFGFSAGLRAAEFAKPSLDDV